MNRGVEALVAALVLVGVGCSDSGPDREGLRETAVAAAIKEAHLQDPEVGEMLTNGPCAAVVVRDRADGFNSLVVLRDGEMIDVRDDTLSPPDPDAENCGF